MDFFPPCAIQSSLVSDLMLHCFYDLSTKLTHTMTNMILFSQMFSFRANKNKSLLKFNLSPSDIHQGNFMNRKK